MWSLYRKYRPTVSVLKTVPLKFKRIKAATTTTKKCILFYYLIFIFLNYKIKIEIYLIKIYKMILVCYSEELYRVSGKFWNKVHKLLEHLDSIYLDWNGLKI